MIRFRNLIFYFLAFALASCGQSHAGLLAEFHSEASFRSGIGGFVNISFDSYVGGETLIGDEYASLGVGITNRDGLGLQIFSSSFGFTVFHDLNLQSNPAGISTPDSDLQNIDFDIAGNNLAVGIWVGNIGDEDGSNNPDFFNDSNGTLVQFIGTSGTVLAQRFLRTDSDGIIQGTASPNNRIFYGVRYIDLTGGFEPIRTIRVFEGTGDGDGVVFDNLQFAQGSGIPPLSVPEPSNYCLLASLFAGSISTLGLKRLVKIATLSTPR